MRSKLSYQQMMEKVENFMDVTGIRKYCVELCKGDCCPRDCLKPCYITGERRLMCSVFICLNMQKLIFDSSQIKRYNEEVRIPMAKIVARQMKKAEKNRRVESFPTQLVYFIPYSEKAKSRMFFSENIARNIETLTSADVINRTEILINMTKTVIRAYRGKKTKIVEEVN
jgi:hypothetical protein